ncbi:hypothetical protein EDD90_6962 [Streptomyces sp. Ag109_O5-1]|nr:hypothetical protein EDD90_6962 [Streptomyces sp. Ag109_O5-1]
MVGRLLYAGGMTRGEIREGLLLLFVAFMEGSLIVGGKLPPAWATGVTVLYAVFLLAYLRGLVRRRRFGDAE